MKIIIMVKKLGRVNRYCIDCGSRLNYYARLSNPKAVNNQRILVYGCPSCTKDVEKPKLLSIQVDETDDTILSMEIHVKKVRDSKL